MASSSDDKGKRKSEDEPDSHKKFKPDSSDELYDEIMLGSEEEVEEDVCIHEDPKPSEDNPFKVLTTEELVQHMLDSIDKVNEVLQLPPTTLRILLSYFHWDTEKLYEAYYDCDGNQAALDRLFSDAKIALTSGSIGTASASSGDEECEICCLQIESCMMHKMECGHRFCMDCWRHYLTSKIVNEGIGEIPCAALNCPIIVGDSMVMKTITDTSVKQKYQHLITNSFVQRNRLLRWCPSAGCTKAIKVDNWSEQTRHPVKCDCNHTFCFLCGHNWHGPVTCKLLQKWLTKCQDDSETSNWIASNTKSCPKCHAMIEKNGGCNHMTCTNPGCKTHFCWVCLGAFKNYDHKCNRFNEAESQSKDLSRAALNRYLFYFNRYASHLESLKFENKLYDSITKKMDEMQRFGMSFAQVRFLKTAVDILCQCRQTLMYTYTFAFYLRQTNQSYIFEDNQQDLQVATESLSEYLERDITSENLSDIIQKVTDKYKYCEKRRQVLLDHVYQGYENDWWEYQAL